MDGLGVREVEIGADVQAQALTSAGFLERTYHLFTGVDRIHRVLALCALEVNAFSAELRRGFQAEDSHA